MPEPLGAVVLAIALLLAAGVARWLLWDLWPLSPRSGVGEPPGRTPSRVTVVVPARDEEASLPHLLASLRDQTVTVAEVVVVDDESHDATARVAAATGATVLSPGAPPPGWTGKAWACHAGAEETSGELLLFLDADVVLAPDAVSALLALHAEHGGLVSVQPHHRVLRPYENASAYFNVVAVMGSGAFARRPPRRPTAFGPCLLTSHRDYDAAGGHAAVRGEILDDVRLAQAYRRAGLPVRCAVGGSVVAMRSYPGGVRQLAAGWTKNIASGAAAADPRASLGAVAWISAHHAVAVGAVTAAVAAGAAGGAGTAVRLALWLLAWAAVSWQLRSILARLGSFRWWTWLLFPVPLLAFDVLFARSAVLTLVRRSVRWQGRVVPLGGRTPSDRTG